MVNTYVEAGSGKWFLLLGMNEKPESGYKNNKRRHRLILNGMLLQVEIKMIRTRRYRWVDENRSEEVAYEVDYPDFSCMRLFEELPSFDEAGLEEYLRRFTDSVIPLLNLSSESKKYIEDNLGRVIDYLVAKLRNNHLKFYKLIYGKSPEENGVIVFGDLSDPEELSLLYPVFGMEEYTSEARGHVPWKPCQNESEEPVVSPFKAVRCYSQTAAAKARGHEY